MPRIAWLAFLILLPGLLFQFSMTLLALFVALLLIIVEYLFEPGNTKG
ncbi:MAG: hypothetical protein P8171_12890 [Candidatus Thiodiazotropha sp.]|jgi:hypothetical protein